MKNLKLLPAFVLLFFFTNNQLLAQKWIPYAGYVKGKSGKILKFEGSGAMVGLAFEKATKKKKLFLDFGLELTFLQSSDKLGGGATCENCDPGITPPGYRQRYLELALPTLIKIKLLENHRSTLMVKSGYAPTLSLPITSYSYRYTDIPANIVERVYHKNPLSYICLLYTSDAADE